MAKADHRHVSMLEKALRSLRLQRIAVLPGQTGPEGHTRRVGDLLLTDEQIVELYRKNRLTQWGLQEFAKQAKKDPA